MSVVPLPLDPSAEARALLNFMLRHGDIVGTDGAGRTILQLAVDPWTFHGEEARAPRRKQGKAETKSG